MKKMIIAVAIVLGAFAAAVALGIGSGMYNVAADEEHTPFVHWLLETTRERSIAARADDIKIPELSDPQRIRRGAGNYDAMCAGCHLKPESQKTEISAGLYPRPPDLTGVLQSDPARAFWIIKHGLKATGMPAWGKSMEDEYLWDMVAFVRKLPELSAAQYTAEVRASGGHSHGGGESTEGGEESESHDESGAGHSHDEEAAAEHSHGGEDAGDEHAHSTSASASGPPHSMNESHAGGNASGDPIEVAKALHAALSSGDAAAVERLLAPDVLIMEGGNVERSRKEYASHHLQSDVKFMKQVSYKLDRQTADAGLGFAWVASEARMSGAPAGKPLDLISTETLVMKKAPSGWRIVHIHWSSRSAQRG